MGAKTGIAWAANPDGSPGETWNPTTGCTKESAACKHCYAKRDWPRLAGNQATVYANREFSDIQCHPERLEVPFRWTKVRTVFVNSMSDLFHQEIPDSFIDEVFAVMGTAGLRHGIQHRFLVLTKRAARMRDYLLEARDRIESIWRRRYRAQMGVEPPLPMPWPLPNVGLGVTAENQATAEERVPLLLDCQGAMHFVSCEPLLGAVSLTRLAASGAKRWDALRGEHHVLRSIRPTAKLDWVIVGGESGPNARPMHPNWVNNLKSEIEQAGVPFFFKQWGEWFPRSIGDLMTDGNAASDWDPEATKWPCVRLTESGGNGRDLAEVDGGEDRYMQRVGRKLAGERLRGEEHRDRPAFFFEGRNAS